MSEKKQSVFARIMDSDVVQKVGNATFLHWQRTTEAYRGYGYAFGKLPPQNGTGLVQSPYADIFNLTWGLIQQPDMPKWRYLYRTRPEIRSAIDKKAALAFGKGFQIACEDKKVETYLTNLLKSMDYIPMMVACAADALVYGYGVMEIVRASPSKMQASEKKTQPQLLKACEKFIPVNKEYGPLDSKDYQAALDNVDQVLTAELGGLTPKDAKSKFKEMANIQAFQNGEPIELKKLDPLYMRIARDAFNDVMGYIQWGLSPIPSSFVPEKIIWMRHAERSSTLESAYGMSQLMPIVRHASMLIAAEEDMKIYAHQHARPTLVAYGGSQEKPYPQPKLLNLLKLLQSFQPNTDMVLPADTKLEPINTHIDKTSTFLESWIHYLKEKIYEGMNIPMMLQITEKGGVKGASADVDLAAFIADEEVFQYNLGGQFLNQFLIPEAHRKFGANIKPIDIIFAPIMEEDLNKKADRIIKLVGRPLVTVNEGRRMINLDSTENAEDDEITPLELPSMGPNTPEGGGNPAKTLSKPESKQGGPRGEIKDQRDKGVDRSNTSPT